MMKTFAEFFAGVGLVREGLDKSHWKCEWANDISKDKRDTYVANFGDNDFHLGDLWEISKDVDVIPNNVFLYTASFPCTDLSLAGGRAGLTGCESGVINSLLDILAQKKAQNTAPKVILLENVKGFLSSNQGKDVAFIVNAFTKLGYFVDIVELDAKDFSAQSRPRIFLIAIEGILAKKTMRMPDSQYISTDEWWDYFEKYPKLRPQKIRAIIFENIDLNWGLLNIEPPSSSKEHLKDIVDLNIADSSGLWWSDEKKAKIFTQMNKKHQLVLENMLDGSHDSYGTVYRRTRNGKPMAELRTDGIAGCLRTPRGGSSKQILICAGDGKWKVRLLTPREYARLQGVRDSFILPSNINKGLFAMGDAVCVPVIEYIAENILDKLYNVHCELNLNLEI